MLIEAGCRTRGAATLPFCECSFDLARMDLGSGVQRHAGVEGGWAETGIQSTCVFSELLSVRASGRDCVHMYIMCYHET